MDYVELLPALFGLKAGDFYIQLASEQDPARVRDRVLQAAEHIPLERLGTCDDCGFSPFGDDTSTPRETAFEKIRVRVEGTRLAAEKLGA